MSGWVGLLVASALGQQPGQDVAPTQSLDAAREAVHEELRRSWGYRRFLRLGARSWYLHPKLWKPGVMVHDEGFVRIRGRPILPLGVRRNAMDPRLTEGVFLVQPRGMRRMQKARLVQGLEARLRSVRNARWALARPEREARLRDELVRIWFERPEESDAEARAAIVERWLRTSTGDAGAGMRAIIDRFVLDHVQPTHPFTAEELAALLDRLTSDRDPPGWLS
ncbi:MAG: hypothetical protein AAF211_01245 [Myxococcota bacterium]